MTEYGIWYLIPTYYNIMFKALITVVGVASAETLVFSDDFDKFNLKTWKHEITMGGGGNWEFELYHNNRTNSFVQNG